VNLGLEGKVALVTGASAGIGAGIARALAAEGVDLAIAARTRTTLEATARDIALTSGRRVVPIVADLATKQGCEDFVNEAHRQFGRMDILVNNAGAARMAPFMEMTDAMFLDALNGKFLAAVRCSRAAFPYLHANGGGIILNITGATQQGVPLHAAGGAANAALRMFSKVLSLELASARIRVNSIAPGRIRTARLTETFAAEASVAQTTAQTIEARMIASIPAGRLGEVEDVARMVCFLASDAAAYVNGAALTVDGGKSPLI